MEQQELGKCVECGGPLPPPRNPRRPRVRRYCSQACRGRYQNRLFYQRNRERVVEATRARRASQRAERARRGD